MQEKEIMLSETMEDEVADAAEESTSEEVVETVEETATKPKRARKKKAKEVVEQSETAADSDEEASDEPMSGEAELVESVMAEEESDVEKPPANEQRPKLASRRGVRANSVLTLEAGGMVETEETLADIAWHTIHNAYRTRRILTGTFGGIEILDSGKGVGIVEYSGYRILIPLKEMSLDVPNDLHREEYRDMIQQYTKRLSNLLGAEIDFVVKGIDSTSRSVVASRKDALLKKRQTFYMEPDASGEPLVRVGRSVQARIIAVHEKVLRVEIFGVETTILARDLSWEWIGDVTDHYSVGDTVLVRITEVDCKDIENITVKAEVKSTSDTARDKLKQCRIQGKYAGKVIDVRKGVVFIRLTNGVNAVAHSCYDRRMPGKKDDVSFVVTQIDEERGTAIGLISRIIKQNI